LKHADFQIICDAGNQRFWRIQPIQLDAIFKYIQHDLTTFKPTFPILYRSSTIDFDLLAHHRFTPRRTVPPQQWLDLGSSKHFLTSLPLSWGLNRCKSATYEILIEILIEMLY